MKYYVSKVAVHERLSAQRVHSGLAKCPSWQLRNFDQDLRRLPRLVPLFPVGSYTPQSTCGHRGPIEPGSLFCCMICHSSGHDGDLALQIESSFGHASKEKSCDAIPAATEREIIPSETRRQRRQRLFRGSPYLRKE
jgi:hypothetical protein